MAHTLTHQRNQRRMRGWDLCMRHAHLSARDDQTYLYTATTPLQTVKSLHRYVPQNQMELIAVHCQTSLPRIPRNENTVSVDRTAAGRHVGQAATYSVIVGTTPQIDSKRIYSRVRFSSPSCLKLHAQGYRLHPATPYPLVALRSAYGTVGATSTSCRRSLLNHTVGVSHLPTWLATVHAGLARTLHFYSLPNNG